MMKIAIEAQRIFRKKKHGMDIVALETIKALQKLDQENEYLIFVKPGPDKDCLPATHNFKIIELDAYTYADWEQWRLPQAVSAHQPDLLHCTSNTAPLRLNVPTCVTVHDVIYLENLPWKGTPYQRMGNLYRRWIVPQIAKDSRVLLTVSNYEKDNICCTLGVANEHVKVVYNGVGGQFQPYYENNLSRALRQKFNLPERFIFFLGNQAPKKNMLNVLNAYKKYRQQTREVHPLVIAETHPQELKKMLHQIQAPELAHHIHLTGYIEHRLLPFFYNSATLFLYPSLRESFGIPIIEAMACGTPVITSDTSAMPEVAGGAAWLVNPQSPEEMAEAIAKVMNNPYLRSSMTQKGLERAKRFCWENTAQQTLEIYENITQKSAKTLCYATSLN